MRQSDDVTKMKRRDTRQRSRQLTKQGHGRLIRGSGKDPNQELDFAINKLPDSAVSALLKCYRENRIHVDHIGADDLKALRKVYFLRRWEDPETCERSREYYEVATQGMYAAKRIIAARKAA